MKGRWGRVFTGITYQSMDSKGRVILPQKFREELGDNFYVTNGFSDNYRFRCIQIMSCDQFDRLRTQIRELPAARALKLQYILVAPATEVSPNSQGRVQIPQALREGAGFKKDLVVLGMDTRIEVWDKETYDEFMKETMQESFAEALELLRL
ncbi:MAG: division/cell wall cluster transcriptional repressor MraZ [Ruminococcus sp.]|nr:division/cell wall cluster transcriptional repressor MraZ [Ruminococcus sp.]